MVRTNPSAHTIKSAAILGVGALVTNGVFYLAAPDLPLPLGNIFLFIAAGALGLSGAIVALAIGVVPVTLWAGDPLTCLRLLILCSALGALAERAPKAPGFLITLWLWIFIFGPLLYSTAGVDIYLAQPAIQTIVLAGLAEVLMTIISGAILLQPNIWGSITHRTRHISLENVLVHVITLASAMAMLLALTGPFGVLPLSSSSGLQTQLRSIVGVIGLGILLPAWFGYQLARFLSRNYQEFFAHALLPHQQGKTFSGLASEYWRRQTSTDLRRSLRETKSETDLNNSAERLRARTEAPILAADEGIVALNRNGTVSFINRRFRELGGVNSNDIVGKRIDGIGLDGELAKHILSVVEETFLHGPRITEFRQNTLPNKLRFFEIRSRRSDAYEGSSLNDGPDSIIIVLKEITERRTVEAHLLRAQKLGSLGAVIGNIAHSFNNTLTAIIGQASFARHTSDSALVQKCLVEMLQAAQQAGSLVNQLLDFAEGRPQLMKPENVATVIGDRLELLRRLCGEDCEINLEVPALPLGTICDANLLTQAITNLALNARDAYQGKPGRIELAIDTEEIEPGISGLHVGARPGKFVRIRVKDAGQGMQPDILTHAFDPLFTTKKNSGHAGLGLSTVFAIVRAHDGFLTTESQPGRGTTISIYLPLVELNVAAALPKHLSSSNGDRNGNLRGQAETILVVEDETNVRELVAAMLSTLGYDVTACGNGAEALEKCAVRKFDLVLVDMIMPRMHGLDLIAKLRDAGADSKALIMTGYGANGEAAKQGHEVIAKPFDLETLGRTIRAILGKAKPSQPAQNLHA